MAIWTDVKTQIRTVLTDDTTYLGLLDDPASSPYRTYYNMNPEEPVYPLVVYGIEGGLQSEGHERSLLVSNSVLQFAIWARNNVYETIADRIIYLLHNKKSGGGWRAILSNPNAAEGYDQEFDAWEKRISFTLWNREAII